MGRQWKGTRNELMKATWDGIYGRNWKSIYMDEIVEETEYNGKEPSKEHLEETEKELGSN